MRRLDDFVPAGKTASELRYMGHTLTDNRHGQVVNAMVNRWAKFHDAQLTKVRKGLQSLDQEVQEAGAAPTIGEMAAGIALDWVDFRMSDENWRDACPNLARWYKRVRPTAFHAGDRAQGLNSLCRSAASGQRLRPPANGRQLPANHFEALNVPSLVRLSALRG